MLQETLQVMRDFGSRAANWSPRWRMDQVARYMRTIQADNVTSLPRWAIAGRPVGGLSRAASIARNVCFPAWENDDMVKARLWFEIGTLPSNTPLYEIMGWCDDREMSDETTGIATSIKAYILCGLDDEAVAGRTGGTPEHIKVYHDLFFAVRPYLNGACRSALHNLICGGSLPANASDYHAKVRHMLFAAMHCGVESVDRLSCPRDLLSSEDREWKVEARLALQGHMSWHRTSANSSAGNYRASDITLAVENERVSTNRALMLARATSGKSGDDSFRQFYEDVQTQWEKYGVNSAPEELFSTVGDTPPAESEDPVKRHVARRII